MMNEEIQINMTHDERAKVGQAINLACNAVKGTEYSQNEVINLVFDRYLPLIKAVQLEYVKRRETMLQFIEDDGEPIREQLQKDPLSVLF